MNTESEIARLRAQIELEHAASVWALSGLATGLAQHAFIQRRLGHMEIAYQQLRRLVGDEQATDLLTQVWEASPEQRRESTP